MKKKRRAVKKNSSRIIIIVLFVAIGIFIINWGKTSVEKIINPIEYYEEVMEAAQEYELDPALILAVIKTESKFYPNAVSRSDAMG